MINIAIYDDSAGDKKNCLAYLVSQFFLSKNIPYCITPFESGIELLNLLKTETTLFDIALIGIIIPEQLPLHTIFGNNCKCVLIFSAYTGEFTLRSNPVYTFDYFDYFAKPSIIMASLEKVLVRIKKKHQSYSYQSQQVYAGFSHIKNHLY